MANKTQELKGTLPKIRKNGTDGLFSTDTPVDEAPATEGAQEEAQSVDEAPAQETTTTKKKVGRPPKDEKDKVSYTYSRTSIIANKEKLRKLEEIAFRQKVMMKEIFEYAFDLVIEKYEKKNGEITEFTKGKPQDIKKRLFD